MIILRPANHDDIVRLVQLDSKSPGGGFSAESFKEELTLLWSHTIVAEEQIAKVSMVGFVVYWLAADEIQLLDIAVDSNRRQQGIGRMLLTHVHEKGRAQGVVRVVLEARPSNDAALALYHRLGYVETGRRRSYYQDGEDALLLECVLS